MQRAVLGWWREKPLPPAWKKTEAGFQKYKRPDNLRVYQHRQFDYSDQFKDGPLHATRPKPDADPPQLFPDFFKYDPKDKLATAKAYTGPLLQWRIEARIVRVSFGMFVGQELSTDGPPDEGAAAPSNRSQSLPPSTLIVAIGTPQVSPKPTKTSRKSSALWATRGRQRTSCHMLGPRSYELKGDALSHYKTCSLQLVADDLM